MYEASTQTLMLPTYIVTYNHTYAQNVDTLILHASVLI
jgi:hypothetical protein